jgi:UDP-N-acetylmuramoyl-tripeptide--D-alanyl-D-alanine ligase
VTSPLIGAHSVYACLAAAAVGFADEMDERQVAAALATPPTRLRLKPLPGRNGATVLDDSYNAAPISMLAALDVLAQHDGRRVAILGDMLELGADAPAYHQALAKQLSGIDGIYCVGALMRHLYNQLPADKGLGWHEDPATLEPQKIAALLRDGDVVVVKGSKKMFWVNKFAPGLVAALRARA